MKNRLRDPDALRQFFKRGLHLCGSYRLMMHLSGLPWIHIRSIRTSKLSWDLAVLVKGSEGFDLSLPDSMWVSR